MVILITGAAGFIGFHVAKYLAENSNSVVGIDNFSEYYDINLKKNRVNELKRFKSFKFIECDIVESQSLERVFAMYEPSHVIHLAAQAGVRYSIENPKIYVDTNVNGFLNVLEMCKKYTVDHLIYASSSSVYGKKNDTPYLTSDDTSSPLSIYAATKKTNELFAYTYSHLFNIRTTGLRFFTVYGPWGRPDMAYYKFTDLIYKNRAISVYNNGNMLRDFTYIDDVVDGIITILDKSISERDDYEKLTNESSRDNVPFEVYNLGNGTPIEVNEMIKILEYYIGMKSNRENVNVKLGDVDITCADVKEFEKKFNFRTSVTLEEGLEKFIEWYREYYNI